MNHIDILKRAFTITWRYRPLWVFGFFLALCGGGGGGGGGNFNFSGNRNNFDGFGNIPNIPEIDPSLIIGLVIGLILLIILLAALGAIVRVVTRTALIGMVRQITQTEAITITDGWHLGWSRNAWRLFLLGLVIGIPLAIVVIILILLAFSPLLLLFANSTAFTVTGIIATVIAFLFIILILMIIGALVGLFQELAWRQIVLDGSGVIASLGEAFGLIKRHFKDVAVIWLLMFGVGFAWVFVSLIVLLPISLIAGALAGGIPALAVYLISNSGIGAAIAGIPLGVLVFILIISLGTMFYLVFQSAVWTLAYLGFQDLEQPEDQEVQDPDSGQAPATLDLQPET